MPKISRFKLEKDIEGLILRQLAKIFQEVNKEEDIDALFNNLFTRSEKIMLAKRIAIAILLEKEWDYFRISKKLKVSPTTISFVKNSKLNTGSLYQKLLKGIEKASFVDFR